jgi:acyl-CoA synthetase (NDP forming)
VLVQQMAAPGVEMILGVVTDPVFGPVVAVGMGGVYVEVLHDVAYRLPPFEETEAMGMLRELRGYKLLGGVRGRPPCKVDALVDAIVRLSWLAHDLRDVILELDVNPLIVSEHGACAADALLVTRPA